MGLESIVFYSFVLSFLFMHGGAAPPSALYIFGDSLADVGNNNYLPFSLLKCNFPHNGVDYPGHEHTGRYSNGKNTADFFAEKIGLASPPPYLAVSRTAANATHTYLQGLNFASGGAGTLDATHKDAGCISMNKQIEYFSNVYNTLKQQLGSFETQDFLSKSYYVISIANNDIIVYSDTTDSSQQYIDSLVTSLRSQLMRMYNMGAKKFVFLGPLELGCTPKLRTTNDTNCNLKANALALLYNQKLAALLKEMVTQVADMSYSFLDLYAVMDDSTHNPASYGYTEVKAACCGLGQLNADIPCNATANLCSNRSNYLFWDFVHPTEAGHSHLVNLAFDGTAPFVYPVNARKLWAL